MPRPPRTSPAPIAVAAPAPATRFVIPALAGAVALAVYLVTLAPGVPGGDSGELIAVAATGGVAHPPGYPLWTLLARAWIALLPAGEVAWRLNLLSAVCAALAAGVLALAVLRLTRAPAAALAAAWVLAFAPPFWKNALVAEVFALNALLAACALEAFARVLERAARPAHGARVAWPLVAMAFLTGLLVTHHHTLVMLALPLDVLAAVLVLAPDRVRHAVAPGSHRPYAPSGALALTCGLALVAGLAPLAWIPLAAARTPALSWGDVHGVRDLLRLLLRVDYGTFRLDPIEAGHVADRSHALLYLASLPRDLGPLGLALGAAGVMALARRRALAIALAGFALLQAVFFTRVGFPTEPPVLRGVVERFYVLPDLVLALVAGLGAAWVLGRVKGRARSALGVALALAAVLAPVALHGARVSLRGNRAVEHLAADVLASVPRDGVLFVRGDVFHNALACLQHLRRLRPDVTVVDQELMSYDWYVRALRRRLPGLLPRLDGGERLTLADGRVIEGRVLEATADTLGVLAVDAYTRLPRAGITRIERPEPATLFRESKRRVRASWLAPPADDRYSGLPGSVNVLWIDHLRERGRPVAFLGLKDDSWALRYALVPTGYVLVAHPRGAEPTVEARARQALDLLAGSHVDDVLVEWDPWSFEAGERARIAEWMGRAAELLCQPSTVALAAGDPGFARLAALVERVETLPRPEPELLRAAGMLRLFHPRLHDPARGGEDLRRWLATGPGGPRADEVRGWLDRLEPAPDR